MGQLGHASCPLIERIDSAVANSIEQFNQHQIDTRARFNFLVQSVLLLAGGALTASIAVFTGSRSIKLSPALSTALGFAWWALVASICLAIVSVLVVLLRDYYIGERWRKALDNPSLEVGDAPGMADRILFVCGLASVASFLAGFIAIAWVATSAVIA